MAEINGLIPEFDINLTIDIDKFDTGSKFTSKTFDSSTSSWICTYLGKEKTKWTFQAHAAVSANKGKLTINSIYLTIKNTYFNDTNVYFVSNFLFGSKITYSSGWGKSDTSITRLRIPETDGTYIKSLESRKLTYISDTSLEVNSTTGKQSIEINDIPLNLSAGAMGMGQWYFMINIKVNVPTKYSLLTTKFLDIYGNVLGGGEKKCVYGASIITPSAQTRDNEESAAKTYIITLNKNGGNKDPGSITRTGGKGTWVYTPKKSPSGVDWCWKLKNGSSYLSAGKSITVTSSNTYEPAFDSYEIPGDDPTYGSIVADAGTKIGYTQQKDKWYKNSNQTGQIDSGSKVTQDITLYAGWSPEKYDILFNKNKIDTNYYDNDKEIWPDTAVTCKKDIYYDSNISLPNFTPTFRGHTCLNKWKNYDKNKELDFGANKPVTDSNGLYNNGNSVTLNTVWAPINHTVTLHYATNVSGGKGTGVQNIAKTYNIDTWYEDLEEKPKYTFFKQGAPLEIPFGDYVFYGWTNIKPKSWDITYGCYKNSVELDADIEKKEYKQINQIYTIKQLNATSAEDPKGISTDNLNDKNYYDNKYAPKDLYALWIVSGKFIKIYNTGDKVYDWRKIDTAYTYTTDGWKVITDMRLRIGNEWKKEVGH